MTDELSADVDLINFAITHRVRSALALGDGDLEAAQGWARSAIEYAYEADFPVPRADARLQLARVLAALERLQEARRRGAGLAGALQRQGRSQQRRRGASAARSSCSSARGRLTG